MAASLFGSTKSAAKKKDPLSVVQKSNKKSRAALAQMGEPDPTSKPNPSALERVFGVLDVLGTGTRALAHNIIDPDKPVDIFGEMGKSLRGEKRIEGADILDEHFGVKNKWAKLIGGVLVDILLDPVTYISLGMGGAGKKAVTSSLAQAAKGEQALDTFVDASKVAKYADYLDDAGHLTADFRAMPAALAQELTRDVAEKLGVKGGVKFMGQTILPVQKQMSEAGAGMRALLEGRVGPQAWQEVAQPVSKAIERGFVHSEDALDLMREGNDVVRAWLTYTQRSRNAALHVADMAGEALRDKLTDLVPDERTRDLVSIALGRVFGDEQSQARIVKAFAAVQEATDDAARAAASDDLLAIIKQAYDLAAIREVLEGGGIAGKELDDALDAARIVKQQFDASLAARRGVGLDAKSLYGIPEGLDDITPSTGYVPGMELSRYNPRDQRVSQGLVDDIMGLTEDVGTREKGGFGRLGKQTPKAQGGKEFLNPEARLKGLTIDDMMREKPSAVEVGKSWVGSDGTRVFPVSFRDGSLTVHLGDDPSRVFISNVVVGDKGKGTGTEMMGETIALIQQRFPEAKTISLLPESVRNREWYARLGFRPDGKWMSLPVPEGTASLLPSVKPLSTELDIAELGARKVSKDMRDIAYKKYADEVTRVFADQPKVLDALEKQREFFTNDEATKSFLRASDRLLNTWRKWATIYAFPMFPARNWISNKFLLFTEDILDPDALAKAMTIAANPAKAADIAVDIGGKTVQGDELLELAQKLRVWVGTPESLQLVGKGAARGKLTRALGEVNQRFVEDADRFGGFIAAMRKGLDPQAAAALVDDALYNYAPEALTVFERNVMRRLTPFYTFIRRNTPHMARLLATSPGKLTWIGHAKEAGESATGIDESIVPDWQRNLFPIPIPLGKDTAMLSTAGILPIQDLERVLPQDPKEWVREFVSSANPFIRDLFVEFPNNVDIYRQGPIEEFPGQKRAVPAYIQAFDDLVADVPVVGDVWGKVKKGLGIISVTPTSGDTYLAANAYAVKVLKDFVPWMASVERIFKDKPSVITQLTGVKMMPYDHKSFEQQKAYDDQQTLSDTLMRLKQEGKTPKKKATVSGLFPKKGKGKKGDAPDPWEDPYFDYDSLLIDNPEPVSPSPVDFGGGELTLKRPQEMLPYLFDLKSQREQYAANKAANDAITAIAAQAQGYMGGGGPSGGGGGRGGAIHNSVNGIPAGGTGHPWQRGTGKYGLQQDFWNRLVRAQSAMAAAGLGRFGVTDGFRSYAQQVVTKDKKGKLAATPGRSRHGLGLAADLDLTPAQQRWLEANGAKFGIYRIPSESWHWETSGGAPIPGGAPAPSRRVATRRRPTFANPYTTARQRGWRRFE